MKIPINDRKDSEADSLGVTEDEVAGPGGATMPGGEATPQHDADAALDEANAERTQGQRMEEAQQAGEVASHREHGAPFAGDPENGLPVDTVESESSGETDENAKKNSDVNSGGESTPEDELTQAKNQLVQLAADFENYKRQASRREQETRERAVRSVVEDLLPVIDNFERAIQAAQSTSDVQSLKVGVEFILQQFQEALKSHGVEPLEAKGQSFDPKKHDAIEEVESTEKPGTVVADVQRGYAYKGNIIRPSRVRVAK
jgi:molecular chaperone GrpE